MHMHMPMSMCAQALLPICPTNTPPPPPPQHVHNSLKTLLEGNPAMFNSVIINHRSADMVAPAK